MDYDDNDFQGQNLSLAGEGNAKISPVLHPYALPKFDFDDSLQGHLRFDSLVENEVFLGIPSQEDNNWIEDFSRGNSEIEFSSSAAESHSIARRHNVWFEATSSESVEMLLKSVGQEEMVPEETIIEESDAADELGSLTRQMELNSKQDDRMDDVIDSQPVQQTNRLLENLSRLNESARRRCLPAECASHTQEGEQNTYRSSSELVKNAVCEKRDLVMTEENLVIDLKCKDGNQKDDTSARESLRDKIPDDSAVSRMQSYNIDASLQNVLERVEKLKDQELSYQGSHICIESENIYKGVEELNALSGVSNMDNQTLKRSMAESFHNLDSALNVASEVESREGRSSVSNFEEPSNSEPKDGCELQVAEQCSEDVECRLAAQGSKPEVVFLSKDTKSNQPFESFMHEDVPVKFEGVEGHVVEVGNTQSDSCASLGQKAGFPMEEKHGQSSSAAKKENLVLTGSQMNKFSSDSNSGTYILSGMDDEPSKQGDGNCIMGGLGSLTEVHSSAELPVEETKVEIFKSGNSASGECKEYSNAGDHVRPSVLAGSMHMNNDVIFSEQGDVRNSEQDTSLNEKGNAELPTDSFDNKCEIVGSHDLDKSVQAGEGIKANGSEELITTGNKPGTAGSDQVIDHGEELESPNYVEGSPPIDKKVEMEVNSPTAAGLFTLNQCSEMERQEDSVTRDSAVQKSHEAIDQSLPTAENCNIAAQGKQAMVDNEVSCQESSEKLEVCQVICDSMVKDSDGAEAVAPLRNEGTTLLENHKVASRSNPDAVPVSSESVVQTESVSVSLVECNMGQKDCEDNDVIEGSGVNNSGHAAYSIKACALDFADDKLNDQKASHGLARSSECDADHILEGGGGIADSDNMNCSSPTIFSSLEPSQNQKEKQEADKTAVGENALVSEVSNGVDGKIQSISEDKSGSNTTKEGKDFTFEVSPLTISEGETVGAWQTFPTIKACKTSMAVEGSPSTSGGAQMDLKIAQKFSHGSPQVTEEILHGSGKGTSERKVRRPSGKSTAKNTPRRGNHPKETTNVTQRERANISCSVPVCPSGISQLVHFEELKAYGSVERGGTKPSGAIPLPTSNLPDLNSSAPPSSLLQQPFTDLQQVQLRAQIFVYGSLIQGAAPEEACMISAFGSSDGGRGAWEPAWRACMERLLGQKSHPNNSETPVQLRPGAKGPEATIQASSPASQVGSKGSPSQVVNPLIPLSSPLWNISTPCDGLQSSSLPRVAPLDYHQALSPLHSYQTPAMRNFVGHNSSWLSQTPFPGHWVASPQTSAIDVNSRFPALPITEAVKLTPVKEPSLPTSIVKHASPVPVVPSMGPGVAGTSSLLDIKKLAVSPSQQSSDSKARKRKKVAAAEDLGQSPLIAQTQTQSVSAPVVSSLPSKKVPITEDVSQASLLAQTQSELVCAPAAAASVQLSTSVAATPAYFAPASNTGKLVTAVSPTSVAHSKHGGQNLEKKTMVSEQTCNTVEEAKLQAEDAAAHAVAAVSHCQSVWSELDKKKNSGLTSDVEAKLASAAVAISAAASIAKAAAAAAKIASNSAAQAKLMVDEALTSGTGHPPQNNAMSLADVSHLWKATPASILRGGDGSNCSSSIIIAAREAARWRVEAASAASKHAENIDALVKAAELAAEAVSQAGKIVAMGDPLPLTELVEAGTEGYWKVSRGPSEHAVNLNNVPKALSNKNSVHEGCNASAKLSDEGPLIEEMETTNQGISPLDRDISKDLLEDQMRVIDGGEKDIRGQRDCRTSDLAKTIGVVPESETGSRSTFRVQDECENVAGLPKENSIMEGCLVEVFKDQGDLKAAWFPANVLSLKDEKALVCYTELQSDEGSVQLKEWVQVEVEGSNAPRIRVAYPMTAMLPEGTRKRRRGAMRDYGWSVGDRVDAWIHDCWREGVVTEKNKKDETTFTVHFPAEGDSSVIKAWYLRPTLIWKDGQWVEWSGSREMDNSSKGDTPQEKRQKLGNPTIEGKGKDKVLKNIDIPESGKHEEKRLLPLSGNEKIFNVGTYTRDENRPDALRNKRTGLHKEGSKGIIGVPKPGKKRKFMEVSKHYVADKSSKNNTASDSVKLAKYLIPQASGSRGWKHNSKVDAKEKETAELKSKVLRSGKSQSVSGRTLPQKGFSLNVASPAPTNVAITDHINKNFVSNDENESGQQNVMEFGSVSNSEEAAEGPILFSSLAPPKKASTSNAKSERMNKVKLVPAGGKSDEVREKSIPETVGPRRSYRRIQPTSRLLEGLQSSLIISKIPAVSHDKSRKTQNRITSKGNSHG